MYNWFLNLDSDAYGFIKHKNKEKCRVFQRLNNSKSTITCHMLYSLVFIRIGDFAVESYLSNAA